jgi:hypothetical protein
MRTRLIQSVEHQQKTEDGLSTDDMRFELLRLLAAKTTSGLYQAVQKFRKTLKWQGIAKKCRRNTEHY